jgi:HAE1 family hydrophobic/amphiphilic exporter-1
MTAAAPEQPEAPRSPGSGGGLIRLAIGRPVTVLVGVLLLILFGLLSLRDVPIQLTPDVIVPTVSIRTRWPGAAPTEVETEILAQQEEVLKSLPNLVKMTALARADQGELTLELVVGSSLEEALVRVTNRLSQVPSYPAEAREPVVSTANASGPPLAVAHIQADDGREVAPYRTWVENKILPRLERLEGVATVFLIGGQDKEIEIAFDPHKLAARKLTLSKVAQVIRGELRDVSGGDLSLGKRRYLVRTPVAPVKPRQLEQVVLASAADGSPIRLGDVAKARYGLRKPGALAFADGRPSLALLFFREAGSNVLETTRAIRRTVAELQRSRLDAEGLRCRLVFDQTGYITGSLRLVQTNLFIGAGLATLVLLLFLRSVRGAALVSVAIPICVIGTALGMALLGRTINIVSLAGMAFAVGMVVDNSIVVLENIHTWQLRGEPPARAALEGTREVWGAILASTMTTAVVFVPIIGWKDEVGALLRDIAVAMSVAVFVSLVVSVLVISAFAGRVLRERQRSVTAAERVGAALRARIGSWARWVAGSVPRSLTVVALAIGGSVAVVLLLLPSMEYLPTGNRNLVFGIMIPAPGVSVEELARVGKGVQGGLMPHASESDPSKLLKRFFYVARPERVFMGGVAHRPEQVGDVVRLIRRVQGKVAGVYRIVTRASLFGRRIGGGRAIEIDISGPKLADLVRVGGAMMGALRKALPGAQARPIPTLDLGAPEVRAIPRREQLAQLGMTPAELGLAVDALVDGAIIGELSQPGQPRLDVVLEARGKRATPGLLRTKGATGLHRTGTSIRTPEQLAAAPVATPGGKVVPLGTLAEIREVLGPTVIQRLERQRAITLQVSPPASVPLEEALARVREQVVGGLRAKGAFPAGVRVSISGTAGQLESAQSRLGWILLLAVLISLLLMAAIFEDFIAPLAILISVPLAAAGGVLGLRLVDSLLGRQPLDMMTALGFLILIGVVVNNAILVVDGALARLREGLRLADAVSEAVMRRVRPILMATLTSLAGLAPLVVASGFGSELYRGIGSVVLGGLALATVLTIFVVPAAFSLLWRLRGYN